MYDFDKDLPSRPADLPGGCPLAQAYADRQKSGDGRLAYAQRVDNQRIERDRHQAIIDAAYRDPSRADWAAVAAAAAAVEVIGQWLPTQDAPLEIFDKGVAETRATWAATWAEYESLANLARTRQASLPEYDALCRLIGWPQPGPDLRALQARITNLLREGRPAKAAVQAAQSELDEYLAYLHLSAADIDPAVPAPARPVRLGIPADVTPALTVAVRAKGWS